MAEEIFLSTDLYPHIHLSHREMWRTRGKRDKPMSNSWHGNEFWFYSISSWMAALFAGRTAARRMVIMCLSLAKSQWFNDCSWWLQNPLCPRCSRHVLALGSTCLLDECFGIKIVQSTLIHVPELKATFYVPASTPNFLWIMDGNFSDCVTGFEEYGLCGRCPYLRQEDRTRWSLRSLLIQTILWFSDSITLPFQVGAQRVRRELWCYCVFIDTGEECKLGN